MNLLFILNLYFIITSVIFKLIFVPLLPSTMFLLIIHMIAYAIFLVSFVIYSFVKKKHEKQKYLKLSLSFLATLLLFFLPIDNQMQSIRFHLLQHQYNKLAEQLTEELLEKEDTDLDLYKIEPSNFYLTIDCKNVCYMKKDDSVLIGFPASESFFIRKDFVYMTGSKTNELIKHAKEISDDLSWIEKNKWAFVKWY